MGRHHTIHTPIVTEPSAVDRWEMAHMVTPPSGFSEITTVPAPRRPGRRQRRADRARALAEAELAAQVARAQRRLAQVNENFPRSPRG